ncbi:putative DNA-binding domain, KAT8 regulatory NSL complex subunit 2 [Arabidopsis thaliana]
MASASKNIQQNPFSSKPPRPPYSSGAASTTAVASTSAEPLIRNSTLNPNPSTSGLPSTSNSPITMSQEDEILARSSHITRSELLKRRSHNLKQLAKCYRDNYWALMEDVKAQHRDYWWKYGISQFKDENNQSNKRRRLGQEGDIGDGGDAVEGSGDNVTNNDGVKSDQYANSNCGSCMYGCKAKAMALTKYCQLHILKDSKQKLYTGCTNVIKRAPAGPLLCGKPTLASTVPALCNIHFQKAQKHVAKALKDAGHNVSSTSKPPQSSML